MKTENPEVSARGKVSVAAVSPESLSAEHSVEKEISPARGLPLLSKEMFEVISEVSSSKVQHERTLL